MATALSSKEIRKKYTYTRKVKRKKWKRKNYTLKWKIWSKWGKSRKLYLKSAP